MTTGARRRLQEVEALEAAGGPAAEAAQRAVGRAGADAVGGRNRGMFMVVSTGVGVRRGGLRRAGHLPIQGTALVRGTLMRDTQGRRPAPCPMPPLALTGRPASRGGRLVAPSGCADALSTRRQRARLPAVPMPAITPAADHARLAAARAVVPAVTLLLVTDPHVSATAG